MTDAEIEFYTFLCDFMDRYVLHSELVGTPYTSTEARELAVTFEADMKREGFQITKENDDAS